MTFWITVLFDRKKYKFKVEKLPSTQTTDSYKVIARNKTLLFSNNVPILKAKNLKHWKPKWVMEGNLSQMHFRDLIVEALEKEILKIKS